MVPSMRTATDLLSTLSLHGFREHQSVQVCYAYDWINKLKYSNFNDVANAATATDCKVGQEGKD